MDVESDPIRIERLLCMILTMFGFHLDFWSHITYMILPLSAIGVRENHIILLFSFCVCVSVF